jgi:hypothetical protein
MRRTTLRALWPGLIMLLLIWVNTEQTSGQSAQQPIELKDITLEYLAKSHEGTPVWFKSDPQTISSVPFDALKLRITARVTNRPAGTKIRLRAEMQETCFPLGPKKSFLMKLTHLTESAPANEEQQIKPDGTIQIELSAHCDDCSHTVCGKECHGGHGGDHLGEGPHVLDLTVSDLTPPLADNAASSKPPSFILQFESKCPKPTRRTVSRADKRLRKR